MSKSKIRLNNLNKENDKISIDNTKEKKSKKNKQKSSIDEIDIEKETIKNNKNKKNLILKNKEKKKQNSPDKKEIKKNESNKKEIKKNESNNKEKQVINNINKKEKDKKILEVKTSQTAAFKQAIERLSNVISDCSIVFIPCDNIVQENDDDFYEELDSDNKNKLKKNVNNTKKNGIKTENEIKKNKGGIRIIRLTEEKNILVKLNLDANNFDYFRCDEPKITIGVDLHSFHNHMKTIDDDYPIILYMNRDDRSTLYIRNLSETNKSSEETDIELYLMDISNPEMPIPPTDFQNKITMASDKFHTICKHLNINSTYVEIRSVNNEILFRGQNENGKITKSYRDMNYSEKKKDNNDQVVQGLYELKTLMCFSKCNKLCNVIEIYLKNDYPLVLVISVATLGKMYVFLSPSNVDNN